MRSFGIHLKAILQEMLKASTIGMSLEITYLKFQPPLPGAIELRAIQ